jgi:hypothetical protein
VIHELKSWPQQFEAVAVCRKFHEVRVYDRPFEVGDELLLREWDPETKLYSGRTCRVKVTYITKPGEFGLPGPDPASPLGTGGTCVMSIVRMGLVG